MAKAKDRQTAVTESSRNLYDVAIPDWLGGESSALDVLPSDGGYDYVGFSSMRSQKWPEMQMAGAKDGQPYLHRNNMFIPCDVLTFFLLKSFTCYTILEQSQEAKVTWASTKQRPEVREAQPHYVALMLVLMSQKLVPARGDFRRTKAPGISTASQETNLAGNPDWAKVSDAHRVAAQWPTPWGRVIHRGATSRRVSQSSGNVYHTFIARSQPSTVTELQILADAMQSEPFRESVSASLAAFEVRCQAIRDIADITGDVVVNTGVK